MEAHEFDSKGKRRLRRESEHRSNKYGKEMVRIVACGVDCRRKIVVRALSDGVEIKRHHDEEEADERSRCTTEHDNQIPPELWLAIVWHALPRTDSNPTGRK